jgi:hypothetical protein
VIKEAASLNRKTAAAATSCIAPILPSGYGGASVGVPWGKVGSMKMIL